jgi:hypothetical protein
MTATIADLVFGSAPGAQQPGARRLIPGRGDGPFASLAAFPFLMSHREPTC